MGVEANGAPLAEVWGGAGWTTESVPDPSAGHGAYLSGVSCPGGSDPLWCMAVGIYVDDTGEWVTLAETWDGTSWTPVTGTDRPGTTGHGLSGVTCADASRCVAVGYAGVSLAEAWDGVTWTLTPSPNGHPGTGSLSGVSCASATATLSTQPDQRPLVAAWDGAAWTKLHTVPSSGVLRGVACAKCCTAVGSAQDPYGAPFAESSSGGTWHVVPTQEPPHVYGATLVSVACPSKSLCQSVGYDTDTGSDTTKQLIETFNGTSWQKAQAPNPS